MSDIVSILDRQNIIKKKMLTHHINIKLAWGVIFILSILMPTLIKAAAWLQPVNTLEVHYEEVTSEHSSFFQGVENKYIRDTKQIYGEYGWHKDLTITGKYLNGRSGTGLGAEETQVELYEITLRNPLSVKSMRLIPLGIKPLWKKLSPEKIKVYSNASFDLGLGHVPREDKFYFIGQLSGSDKIETTHKNPLTFFGEFSLNYQRDDNSNQGVKAISRLQLEYRNFHLAYERLDGRFWGETEFNEHFWFAELGVPLTKNVKIISKIGHERVLSERPRETSVAIGIQLKY